MLLNRVLRIFLNSVEKVLLLCSLNAPDHAGLEAVLFVYRLGSTMNGHIHFHCCVNDGVFSTEDKPFRFYKAIITRKVIMKV